jgi:hypothetical protein
MVNQRLHPGEVVRETNPDGIISGGEIAAQFNGGGTIILVVGDQ